MDVRNKKMSFFYAVGKAEAWEYVRDEMIAIYKLVLEDETVVLLLVAAVPLLHLLTKLLVLRKPKQIIQHHHLLKGVHCSLCLMMTVTVRMLLLQTQCYQNRC
jgi:hypothetical protein